MVWDVLDSMGGGGLVDPQEGSMRSLVVYNMVDGGL